MTSPFTAFIAFAVIAAAPTVGSMSVAAAAEGVAEVARLEAAGSEDPQAWFELAQSAREAGELELATKALTTATGHGLSAIQSGIESARIFIAGNEPARAVAELDELAASGFTAVRVLRRDPLIGSLAGRDDYERLLTAMSVQAFPCGNLDVFGEFDFWVGEWEVRLANDTVAGSNRIERAEMGCVLTENWTSASGGTGMSVNYVDMTTGEWVQIWNAESGTQINIRGGLTDDGMLLEGYIHYVGSNTTAPFRGLWTPLPDGRVRQYFEQSSDDGQTWAPWFEGFYSRVDKGTVSK